MLDSMSRNWWMILIRGIAAVVFGLAILFLWPGLVISTLVIVFAAYALVDGVFAILTALQHRDQPRWWAMVLEGIIGIIAAIVAFVYPGLAVLTLLYVIAAWAVITGVLEIVSAIELRKQIPNEFWMILSGIFSVIFGILLVVFPISSILTLLWLFGGICVAFGIFTIILAFRVHGMGGTTTTQTHATA